MNFGYDMNWKYYMLAMSNEESSSSSPPCFNEGPIGGELPILQEKLKIQILGNISHF